MQTVNGTEESESTLPSLSQTTVAQPTSVVLFQTIWEKWPQLSKSSMRGLAIPYRALKKPISSLYIRLVIIWPMLSSLTP